MSDEQIKERAADPLSGYNRLMSLPDVMEATGLCYPKALKLMNEIGPMYLANLAGVLKEELRKGCEERGIPLCCK